MVAVTAVVAVLVVTIVAAVQIVSDGGGAIDERSLSVRGDRH